MLQSFRKWVESGSPWIWLNAGAVSVCLVMVIGLLFLIAARGLGQFWPAPVIQASYIEEDGQQTRIVGQISDTEVDSRERLESLGKTIPPEVEEVTRYLLKIGNRDFFGLDFRWVNDYGLGEIRYPEDLMVVEREEWGNLYGELLRVRRAGVEVGSTAAEIWNALQQSLERRHELQGRIRHIEKDLIGSVNYEMEQLRLEKRGLELDGVTAVAAYEDIERRRAEQQAIYAELNEELGKLYIDMSRDTYVVRLSDGREVEMPVAKMVRAYLPNAMGLTEKIGFYLAKAGEFVFDDPREANTEGGIFPAIFGTVMMVMIMSVMVTPFGVVAAVYLREYATQGPITRTIRIAVNNLAGVPSVVYGVFGLGFMVYFLGGNIDQWFYREALPAPTFGTPGLMWSSLTLAILTVPVVIVATEEGLSRIPNAIREGSLALGATKAETLWRTILPMASPAMMTGLILAVARAAGEVAPLMMVGVVKLAPSLPLDGNAPFLHLDRKFMHLGFHIYDVGFQSPNVEAARPLVYATAMLLVVIIVSLNLAAIRIRNRLREKYRATEH